MSDPLIGTRLGDYTLRAVVATGGMARIYEGFDERLERSAAVKVLALMPDEEYEAEEMTERFKREARAIANLEHDNIITLYQYGEQDGYYFLVMRLIRGTDLARELARLRKSGLRMEVTRALRILEQIAAALDHAHQHGIVHRDVKPSNILLDRHDKAILTDFGLLLKSVDNNTLGTAFGTPRYMAPEQAVASASAVYQTDIYALAIILYEILTGRTPFDGDSPMEIAIAHINDPVTPPRTVNPNIPEAVEVEVLKALDKDPTKRHASAGAFITAVKAAYDPSGGALAETELTNKTEALPLEQLQARTRAVTASAPPITPPVTPEPPAYAQPAAPPQPVHEPPNQRSFLPIVGVLLIVAVVVVAIIALISSAQPTTTENQTATRPPSGGVVNVPTATTAGGAVPVVEITGQDVLPTETPTDTPTTTPTPSPALMIVYDEIALTVRALHAAVNTAPLTFSGNAGAFGGESITRARVDEDACFRLRLDRQVDLLSGCGALTETVISDPNRRFWRQPFTVYYNGAQVAECPALTSGTLTTCEAALPVTAGLN